MERCCFMSPEIEWRSGTWFIRCPACGKFSSGQTLEAAAVEWNRQPVPELPACLKCGDPNPLHSWSPYCQNCVLSNQSRKCQSAA